MTGNGTKHNFLYMNGSNITQELIGIVKDVYDPKQMGRISTFISALESAWWIRSQTETPERASTYARRLALGAQSEGRGKGDRAGLFQEAALLLCAVAAVVSLKMAKALVHYLYVFLKLVNKLFVRRHLYYNVLNDAEYFL